MDVQHYNQPQRRKAEYIKPPNLIKAKVGDGGLTDNILDRAQKLLENNSVDFGPLADIYLTRMMEGINRAKAASGDEDLEYLIAGILYPCAQLKANGGMFHYPLVTRIAERFVQFMEVVERIDPQMMEIATAFHTTIRAVVAGKVKGDGGQYGNELVEALNGACMRYFEKHKKSLEKK
ncbi:MAG: hypothetical protein KDI13_09855 [Alphaproteobacteria bacterium]|nr:hypothetical protein [Alphaproteobacteria bacterium]